jgi:hypothetical protein
MSPGAGDGHFTGFPAVAGENGDFESRTDKSRRWGLF